MNAVAGVRQGRRVRISDLAHPAFGRAGVYVRKAGGALIIRLCGWNDLAQAWTFSGCIAAMRHQVSVP